MLIEKLYWITNEIARMQVILVFMQLEIREMQRSKVVINFFSKDGNFSLLTSSFNFYLIINENF